MKGRHMAMADKKTTFYTLVIFLGAFLIFQIQPIISKFILPWFGGTPSVWTVCMLFFQLFLFGGYLYAHLLTRGVKPLAQFKLHGTLLLVSVFLIISRGVLPAEALQPNPDTWPTMRILIILIVTIGLPYLCLAASSPLIQFWFAQTNTSKDPYLLYVFSNVGSLLALLSYPILVEPLLTLHTQSTIWIVIFVFFALSSVFIVRQYAKNQQLPVSRETVTAPKQQRTSQPAESRIFRQPDIFQAICWIVLPMLAAILLLATTNQLCTDVSSGPFLWLLPLSLYLITFILTFTGWRFLYQRTVYFAVLIAAMLMVGYIIIHYDKISFLLQIAIYCGMLFFSCMAAHAEVYQLRPDPRLLTRFYLSISAGGALGGIFVGLIAPAIFNNYYELHLGCIGLLLMLILCRYHETKNTSRSGIRITAAVLSMVCVSGLGVTFSYQISLPREKIIYRNRNFFGITQVLDLHGNSAKMHHLLLRHGNTDHGLQFIDTTRQYLPTTYYGLPSGIAMIFKEYPRSIDKGLHIGAVGLGVGTITAYAQPGDEFRFYEINPDVIDMAQNIRFFSFISHARSIGSKVDIIEGDARLSMERDLAMGKKNTFDFIVLDAFSSDAIPTHLLTREAFDLYFNLLKLDGVLAIHITNRNVDLAPVVDAVANYYHYMPYFFINNSVLEDGVYMAQWILLSNNKPIAQKYFSGKSPISPEKRFKRLWTDDFSNLWGSLKKNK